MKRSRGHVLLLGLVGCAGSPEPRPAEVVNPSPPTPAPIQVVAEAPGEPLLPAPAGPFAPALTVLAAQAHGPGLMDRPVTGTDLADTKTCESCHADVAAQWQGSAHAFASFNNPIYRTSIERFREARTPATSRFCAGCHDPALLVDGAMDTAIAANDPRAHAGITCQTCHGIEHATFDGNGSYRLRGALLAAPAIDDPASVAAHKLAARPAALGGAAMCSSCHKAFLGVDTGHPHHIPGTDDVGPWLHSAYAGSRTRLDEPVPEASCAGCHMPLEPATRGDMAADAAGKVSSHRFLGGHTWLAAMRGDEAGVAQIQKFLQDVVSVDVAAVTANGAVTLPADGAPVTPGARLEFDVVVRNLGVGHNFPGGTRDAQDAWVELTVHASDGRVLASTDQPHRLGSAMADMTGVPQLAREIEDLHLGVYDHTIGPRDARVVRFGVDVPEDMPASALPLRLVAKVQHRSRTEALRAATCDDSRKKPGKAFLAATKAIRGETVDACAAQPISAVATAEVWIGAGAPPADDSVTARRLYVHGLGLLHEVQEHVGRAGRSFDAALARTDDPQLRAQILAGLTAVASRQGRVDDARALAAKAAALAPGHPAPAWLEGQALAAVWRWQQAVEPLAKVAASAPMDPSVWADLALAHGSAGQSAGALRAARSGLQYNPRHSDLLRIQALAQAELASAVKAAPADAAMSSYLDHRSPDNAPRVRSACSRDVPGCARERLPVHTHDLRWR